ncbi:MAG: tRNA uridine-5-carboxymethylaminomethyl(34) synthesis GTPase MnmE [Thermodesulfobacteriota bacterium]
MNELDTIAAVSTPAGEGGIGIIRISGPDALTMARKVFFPKGGRPLVERFLHYGLMKGPDGETLDSGCMVFMNGPRSYTGEDVAELHCHGGALVLKDVLCAVVRAGARLAGPGEFTRRAFLAGKLDLAQAEAVIDVIRAGTDTALASARGRLEGALSRRVGQIKEALLGLLTTLEAELDFPEDEFEGLSLDDMADGLQSAGQSVERLLSTFEEGRALREGVRVLILGRPNVGKSSLLNILLEQERAIVTPVPGTTRDVIEEVINIRGIPVRLMDTAGLRETSDVVESIGVRSARNRIEDAGLILFVVDASAPETFGEDLAELRGVEGRPVVVVANKSDLVEGEPSAKAFFEGYTVCHTSAVGPDGPDGPFGIEELKDEVAARIVGSPAGDVPPGELVASVRHRDSLERCLEGVERARRATAAGVEKEFIATDIRWAIDRLGEITGETTTEDILERIFSTFCIGK